MKTLKDVVKIVQHELDCSISELSRKLGKSRNYLFTHLKNGLSAEKEQEIIKLLLELVDDENRMLRNVFSEQEETITAYRDKIAVQDEEINGLKEENRNHLADNLNSEGMYLFQIEQQGKLISELYHKLEDLEKTMDSLSKAGHSTGNLLNKEKQKTRILSIGITAIAVVSTIALWWLS